MGLWIVNIHGEISGDCELIERYNPPKIKKGYWLRNIYTTAHGEKISYYKCSACGVGIDNTMYNYCPNCGAKMEGREK